MNTSPSCSELKSLKHDDIISCILDTVAEIEYNRCEEYPDFGNWNQEEWLRDVTNRPYGWNRDEFGEIDLNPVINWDNPQSVAFAILNLSAAGQKLNLKKLEEEGIDDYIGTHFPKFKNNPKYSPYPKNYMNSSQPINPINNALNIEVKKPSIDPNKCFNEELLKACIEADIPIAPFLEGYGELVHAEPQLIWVDEIHGLEPITGKDGKIRPRGFQTRADEDVNHDIVGDISYAISNKKWNPKLLQGAVFTLEGTNFEGCSFSSRGIERKYGIANLTHRLAAAKEAGEDFIIAWVIKIPIAKLTKWACAIANAVEYASNPRKDGDIVRSIKLDMESPDSELAKLINNAPEDQRRSLMEKEVDTYNVKAKTRNSIVRKLEQQDVYQVERKRHDSETLKSYISEHCIDYKPVTDKNVDYVTDKGVKVFTAIAQGDNHLSIAKKIAINLACDKPSAMIVPFANDNSVAKKITKNNREEKRSQFPKEVRDVLKTFGIAYQKLFVDRTHTLPQFLALPEFADEYENLKENGERFIDVN